MHNRFFWYGLVLALFALALGATAQSDVVAKQGLLKTGDFDFSASTLELNGEWNFFWNELLTPNQVQVENLRAKLVNFPSYWDVNQGFATYQLTVVLNKNFHDYSIELPSMYTSYTVWFNGNLAAKNGEVGTNRKTARAQYLPQLIQVPHGSDTLRIVLQIANFSHSKGGIKDPLVLGLTPNLASKRKLGVTVNTILVGVMFFVGLFFLNLYLFVKKEKSILYFSLMCLVWAIRSMFSEWYLAIQWMPGFDWELAAKIEYITIYMIMVLALQFIACLYPLDTHVTLKRMLIFPNYLFVGITMTTYAIFYTRFLNVYLVFAGLVILYVIFIILRAIVYERYGAWFSVLGIFAGVVAFSYNILAYERLFDFNPVLYYAGWLLIVLFLSIALAYQLSPNAKKFNVTDTLTWDDFMK